MSEKEKRIRAITRLYYSNPKIQEAIFNFAKDREVIPRYFEGFGKRPDTLNYPADVMGLVNKGATSFHCSEEIWHNPLEIDSDMLPEELSQIRKLWDLLIDIDSPFLDYSKIAAELIIESLEKHGIKNYRTKFSGSKGFHIIVPAKAFPEKFQGIQTKTMFPEWPRAISEYLMNEIRQKYNQIVSAQKINFKALEQRTNLKKEDITESVCPRCGKQSKKGIIIDLRCNRCKTQIQRKNHKITKRKLRCIEDTCPGFLEITKTEDYFSCPNCNLESFDKTHHSQTTKKVVYTRDVKFSQDHSTDFKEEVSGEQIASLDLVLVASRHLFRMPYSLHEKTALSSVVIKKDQIQDFTPKDANPLKVNIKEFYPKAEEGEATKLLEKAIQWKSQQTKKEESELRQKYKNFEKITVSGVTEDLFPKSIKKLLKGLKEGRKRGAFILITFLRSLNFSSDYINTKVRDWNKKNTPPLKEGYIKSQIEWHLKQKRQILPPNYENKSFYKDLNLIESGKEPNAKNPIAEVLRKIRQREY